MRLPTERQAFTFLEPLRGKSAIVTVRSRREETYALRFILTCLALSRTQTIIFDTSAFVGTNSNSIAGQLFQPFLQRTSVLVPQDEFRESLIGAVMTDAAALLIDDLNALLYLMSPRGSRSGMRRLSAFFHLLAYEARLNGSFAIGMAYKQESGPESARSLMAISDLKLTAEVKGDQLSFKCREAHWRDDVFTVPLYLDKST